MNQIEVFKTSTNELFGKYVIHSINFITDKNGKTEISSISIICGSTDISYPMVYKPTFEGNRFENSHGSLYINFELTDEGVEYWNSVTINPNLLTK